MKMTHKPTANCQPTHFDDVVILNPRNWLLYFATVGWVSTAIEMLFHLIYAQTHVPAGWQLAVGLCVIFVGNGLPLFVTRLIWRKTVYEQNACSLRWPWLWVRRWGYFELIVGVSFYFLFGSGFYIGPSFLILDSLVRIYEDVSGWRPENLADIKDACDENTHTHNIGPFAPIKFVTFP